MPAWSAGGLDTPKRQRTSSPRTSWWMRCADAIARGPGFASTCSMFPGTCGRRRRRSIPTKRSPGSTLSHERSGTPTRHPCPGGEARARLPDTDRRTDRPRRAARPRTTRGQGRGTIEAGAASIPFFVVVAGSFEVVRPSASSDTLITVHHPGGFTGEVNMLTGRRTLVRSRAAEDSEVIELTRDQPLSSCRRMPQLGDIFMRAFILRRIELIASGIGGVVLIGSIHLPGTLRIRIS